MHLVTSCLSRALIALALGSAAACSGAGSAKLADAGVEAWPVLSSPALDPQVEQRVDDILSKMTLEQKVGQVIQADSDSVTPEQVRQYRLGSVLSGGNSAPGDEPYADARAWLEAADAYYEASIDPEGVEVAVPIIWGIDAVHGHANLEGATVFPHNIGLGAANDPELIERIMQVTAAELIVSGHDWTFAPTLAVPRDDRWGRTYEGFSESPLLVASYADRIVYGLQGRPGTPTHFDEARVISTAKHFVGDGGTLNGTDQGNTAVSEKELRDIHAAGYFPAIEAGVLSVMASFNSWNGQKLHGSRYMLTEVLKERMGFTGFVVGDWNGHGQIPGCTNTDCPDALLAGIDMYMAPDSWLGLYESTLAAVQSGKIPMERLDDAVRRILRAKVVAGLFEKPKPSLRVMAGNAEVLASASHRAIAREAVRKSLVLLKNDNQLLPLNPASTVLVTGDGADSISKQSGGWTLSWQGGGYANSDFPNGESILDGLRSETEKHGGTLIFDPEGTAEIAADVVIAVYGEDPYAEFQGDLDHLDFVSPGFDTARLKAYRDRGIPVVSIFLSGRPLWVNPELNASDAFIAAWLPGTEGGGIADMVFRSDSTFDFSGKLSFSWPSRATDFRNNEGEEPYTPLFTVGYGLSYSDKGEIGELSEESGLGPEWSQDVNAVFRKGGTTAPWKAFLMSDSGAVLFNGTGANLPEVAGSRADHLAQEDAIRLSFSGAGAGLVFLPEGAPVDWSGALQDEKVLAMAIKLPQDAEVTVGLACEGVSDCAGSQAAELGAGDWREVRIPLSCLAGGGDLAAIATGLSIRAPAGTELAIADVRLAAPTSAETQCQ